MKARYVQGELEEVILGIDKAISEKVIVDPPLDQKTGLPISSKLFFGVRLTMNQLKALCGLRNMCEVIIENWAEAEDVQAYLRKDYHDMVDLREFFSYMVQWLGWWKNPTFIMFAGHIKAQQTKIRKLRKKFKLFNIGVEMQRVRPLVEAIKSKNGEISHPPENEPRERRFDTDSDSDDSDNEPKKFSAYSGKCQQSRNMKPLQRMSGGQLHVADLLDRKVEIERYGPRFQERGFINQIGNRLRNIERTKQLSKTGKFFFPKNKLEFHQTIAANVLRQGEDSEGRDLGHSEQNGIAEGEHIMQESKKRPNGSDTPSDGKFFWSK